jgi:hypothetical protein
MTMPGFTAEATAYGQTPMINGRLQNGDLPSLGGVTMATWVGYRYCGQCRLGEHACPNPEGFGCNVCVPLNSPCGIAAPPR